MLPPRTFHRFAGAVSCLANWLEYPHALQPGAEHCPEKFTLVSARECTCEVIRELACSSASGTFAPFNKYVISAILENGEGSI
ncbi:hypothetical protein J9303_04720 [Bacillaceae bacterium Marseille-Q3522]|nr:hypothetical protein [Bacillaceae bacterium Marseille-Q3522]